MPETKTVLQETGDQTPVNVAPEVAGYVKAYPTDSQVAHDTFAPVVPHVKVVGHVAPVSHEPTVTIPSAPASLPEVVTQRRTDIGETFPWNRVLSNFLTEKLLRRKHAA